MRPLSLGMHSITGEDRVLEGGPDDGRLGPLVVLDAGGVSDARDPAAEPAVALDEDLAAGGQIGRSARHVLHNHDRQPD